MADRMCSGLSNVVREGARPPNYGGAGRERSSVMQRVGVLFAGRPFSWGDYGLGGVRCVWTSKLSEGGAWWSPTA